LALLQPVVLFLLLPLLVLLLPLQPGAPRMTRIHSARLSCFSRREAVLWAPAPAAAALPAPGRSGCTA